MLIYWRIFYWVLGILIIFCGIQERSSAQTQTDSVNVFVKVMKTEQNNKLSSSEKVLTDNAAVLKPVRKKEYLKKRILITTDTPLLMQQTFIPRSSSSLDTTKKQKQTTYTVTVVSKIDHALRDTSLSVDATLIQLFIKQKTADEVYFLVTLWVIWVILRFLFSDYYYKVSALTHQCLFKFYYKNNSILTHFRIESIFFRLFSISIYAYTIWIYFYKTDFFRLFVSNQNWVLVKIIFLLVVFYLLRFLLIRFWKDKSLNYAQITFHSAFCVGSAVYLLIYDSILTFINKSGGWYEDLRIGLLYLVIYLFLVKGIITIKTYLKSYSKHFYILFYLVCFEFVFPLSLLWLFMQEMI